MSLRGFDSYEISLGDQMRGERASLGMSLEDVEREMRIKARIIVAIEDCDLEGFPNQSVIAGYVRSYSRFLGMDSDECFKRFCEASGYRSPSTTQIATVATPGRLGSLGRGIPADPITHSRFAAASVPSGLRFRVSFGALGSSLALLVLIAGLSYGGYALLQDIQRVGFAPLPEAPSVVADAPVINVPDQEGRVAVRPDASAYDGGGILTAVVLPAESPVRRDGPISAIDPSDAGVFEAHASNTVEYPEPEPAEPPVEVGEAAPDYAVAPAQVGVGPSLQNQQVALVAAEEAWVRIREGDRSILYEGVMGAGERFELPERLVDPVLRAGNAGGIFVVVDGIAYGPLGQRGRVVGGVSLRASDVRAQIPQAQPAQVEPASLQPAEQRADATGTLPRN